MGRIRIRIRVTVGVIDSICGVVQKNIAKRVLVLVLAILFTSIVNNPGAVCCNSYIGRQAVMLVVVIKNCVMSRLSAATSSGQSVIERRH